MFALLLSGGAAAEKDLTRWVDPLIGTLTSYELSRGNTYPSASRPSGMTSWSPQTGSYENALFYDHSSDSLNGIRASKWARCRGSTYIRQCREDGSGEPGGNRTHGQRLKRPLLYP